VGSDKLLYIISLPRGKHAKLTSSEIRLAWPQKFISEVVEKVHQFGHFSKERNFQFLRSCFYAKNLFDAVCKYCASCDRCQRYKRDRSQTVDPLHCLAHCPSKPGEQWACHHLVLSRPTVEGFTVIICFIDLFSQWPVIRLVRDVSVVEAAKVFFTQVVSVFKLSPSGQTILHTDKGASFTSKFVCKLCKLLNVRLITSTSQISRSNGAAESLIQTTKQGLKTFADSDLHLSAAIPLIEISLRASPRSSTQLSPFEIVMGRQMSLPILGTDPLGVSLRGDQQEYFNIISKRLAELHNIISETMSSRPLALLVCWARSFDH